MRRELEWFVIFICVTIILRIVIGWIGIDEGISKIHLYIWIGLYSVMWAIIGTLYVNLQPQRYVNTDSRSVPQDVQMAVVARDGNQCAHVNWIGQRCKETTGLEYDHIIPFSKGGDSTEGNVQILCRGHNREKGSKLV